MAINKLINLELLKQFKGKIDELLVKKADVATLNSAKSELQGKIDGKLGKLENAASASKLATAREIKLQGGVSGTVDFDGSENVVINTTLSNIDASKITTGTISIDRLPATAIERVYVADNQAAMLKLTKTEVQNGDIVNVEDTKKWYFVIDDTKLGGDTPIQAFKEMEVGKAGSVDWANIQGKPAWVKDYSADIAAKGDKTAVTANTNAIAKLNGADSVEGSVANKIKTALDPVSEKATANATAIAGLKDGTVQAGVAKKIANALTVAGKKYDGSVAVSVELTHTDITDFDASVVAVDLSNNVAVKANTDAIATLNGESTVPGSVDKKIADAINPVSTKANANEANITKITNGTTVVPKATHATKADSATTATTATNATNATTASKVANSLTIGDQSFNGSAAVSIQYATAEEIEAIFTA